MNNTLTQRKHSPRSTRRLVVLGLLIIAVGIGAVLNLLVVHTSTTTRTFAVGSSPRLAVSDKVGNVIVHGGTGNTIMVQATKRGGLLDGALSSMSWTAQQTGQQVTINTSGGSTPTFLGDRGMDLSITVPHHTAVDLSTSTGSIDIENVAGQIRVGAGTGSVHGRNLHLQGTSFLVALTGSITASASLDRHGSYRFQTGTGSQILTLPADSAFSLTSSVGTGSFMNQFHSNRVGTSPRAQVNLSTGTGSILLQRAP